MRWANENRYDGLVLEASRKYNVPMSLIKAVIAAESGFNPGAIREETRPASDWPPGVTEDASRGLMQLLEWRARDLGYRGGVEGLFDPYTNINLGSRLLSINAAQLGSWEAAISAYNGGIRPELGFGAPRDGRFANQAYVDRVERYWTYFETGVMPVAGEALFGLLVVIVGAFAFFPLAVLDLAQSAAPALIGLSEILAPINTVALLGIAYGAGKLVQRVSNIEQQIGRCLKDSGP